MSASFLLQTQQLRGLHCVAVVLFLHNLFFFDNFASGGWSSSAVARPMLTATAFAEVSPDPAPGVTTVTTVRNSFPVVWFFGQTQISESGSASVPLTVPGTITQWIGDTVCLDPETGFGMTKEQANLTSYQDFFVIDSLPYSIVRGEILTARIIVSSTLSTCAQVRASIKPSDDFTVEAIDGDKNQCICSGQRATFSFNLNAKSVGVVSVSITGEAYSTGSSCEASPASDVPNYKDTIERTFIVEPEGIPTEVTRSTLTCVKDEEVVLPIETSPAPNSLEDTVKRRLVFIGEIVGRAFVNPESMIKDPTGCGEQNLATLMPIALVLDYMNLTGRLTGEIKSRAVQFMANGYIRQIRFRNSDGSFSTFPRQEGNSWLTLQTLATLERIKKYTMVEDKVPNQALVYLERLKDPNTGAFKPRGPMYNNALKGAAEDDVTFTALLAAYLLESSYAASPTLVREALAFLVAASQKDQSVYNTALLFYVFRVAGNMERSGAMLNKLKGMQKEEEGGVFWERTNKPNNPQSYVFSSQAPSAEIQITSYVLKGLTVGSPTPADLGLMSQIALWISRQQNALGSYSTTADSMVALDAICSYGFLVYQKDATNVIRVKNGGETVAEFNLDSEKRNFLQSQPLPNTPGDYSVSISGNGCVLTQSVVNSNIPVNEDDSAFLLTVDTPSESCVDGVAYTFPVALNVSYKGQRNESNMAIVDVALPSGYTLEYKSLMELRRKVAKVEQKNNHIIIYLEKVSSEVISLNMTFKMNTRVQNMQQRYVLGWDYYDKGDNGIAVIRHPCSSQ